MLTRKIAWLALACAAGLPTAASCQSSVVVYGKVDIGLRYIPNSNPQGTRLIDEKSSTNRLGFRGQEDLGGGMAAIFTLENGFNGDDGTLGQSGRAFGRQAFVGLRSRDVGTLMMGRQDTPMFDYLAPISAGVAQWGGSSAAHWGDIDNVNAYFRVDNSVKYASPVVKNATMEGFYGFGEQPGHTGRNQTFGGALRYRDDTYYLAASLLHVANPIEAVYDGNLKTNVKGTFGTSVYAGLQAASALMTYGVAAGYNFGKSVKLNAIVTETRFANSTLARGDASYQTYELNSTWYLTPRFQLGGAYMLTNGHWSANGAHPRIDQINLGASYSFSRGVSIYWRNAFQKAGGDAHIAQVNLLPASNNNKQFLANIGLRYAF